MSIFSGATTSQRPILITTAKSSGWGWPRLVDIPTAKHTPSSRRSSSAQSHRVPPNPSQRSQTDTSNINRASSMSNLGSLRSAPLKHRPTHGKSVTETDEVAGLPLVDSKDYESTLEAPAVEDQAAPGFLPLSLSERKGFLAIASSPELDRVCTVPDSADLDQPDPLILPPLPSSPQSGPPEASAEAHTVSEPSTTSGSAEAWVCTKLFVPEPTQRSPFEETGSGAGIAHSFRDIGSETSEFAESVSKSAPIPPLVPERGPVSTGPVFDYEQLVSPFAIPAPFNMMKLPPPEILIIRASSDSGASSNGMFSTAKLVNEVDRSPVNVITSLPHVSKDVTIPDMSLPNSSQLQALPLPGTGLVPENLGDPTVVVITRHGKGKKMIRKTRGIFLQSPVLNIILGRQLARLTRPALKMIANGANLPPMVVLGQGAGVIGAAEGPVEAFRSPLDAPGAPIA